MLDHVVSKILIGEVWEMLSLTYCVDATSYIMVVESTLLSCQREVKVFKNMTKRAQITVFSLCNIKIRRGGFELKKSVDHR